MAEMVKIQSMMVMPCAIFVKRSDYCQSANVRKEYNKDAKCDDDPLNLSLTLHLRLPNIEA
jgi:hypothetical protein